MRKLIIVEEVIDFFCLNYWSGWSESILRCARARGKPRRRGSSRDDGSKCDWVHWWIKNSDIWWLELTLPHTLWPKAQCFTIPWACFHHRWTFEKEQDEIAASNCPSRTVKAPTKSNKRKYLCSFFPYIFINVTLMLHVDLLCVVFVCVYSYHLVMSLNCQGQQYFF